MQGSTTHFEFRGSIPLLVAKIKKMEHIIYNKACALLTKKVVEDELLKLIQEKVDTLNLKISVKKMFVPDISHFTEWIINQPIYYYKNNFNRIIYLKESYRKATIEEFKSSERIRDLVILRSAIVLFYQLYYFKIVPLRILAEYIGKKDHSTIISLRDAMHDQINLTYKDNKYYERWMSLMNYVKENKLIPEHPISFLNKNGN